MSIPFDQCRAGADRYSHDAYKYIYENISMVSADNNPMLLQHHFNRLNFSSSARLAEPCAQKGCNNTFCTVICPDCDMEAYCSESCLLDHQRCHSVYCLETKKLLRQLKEDEMKFELSTTLTREYLITLSKTILEFVHFNTPLSKEKAIILMVFLITYTNKDGLGLSHLLINLLISLDMYQDAFDVLLRFTNYGSNEEEDHIWMENEVQTERIYYCNAKHKNINFIVDYILGDMLIKFRLLEYVHDRDHFMHVFIHAHLKSSTLLISKLSGFRHLWDNILSYLFPVVSNDFHTSKILWPTDIGTRVIAPYETIDFETGQKQQYYYNNIPKNHLKDDRILSNLLREDILLLHDKAPLLLRALCNYDVYLDHHEDIEKTAAGIQLIDQMDIWYLLITKKQPNFIPWLIEHSSNLFHVDMDHDFVNYWKKLDTRFAGRVCDKCGMVDPLHEEMEGDQAELLDEENSEADSEEGGDEDVNEEEDEEEKEEDEEEDDSDDEWENEDSDEEENNAARLVSYEEAVMILRLMRAMRSVHQMTP